MKETITQNQMNAYKELVKYIRAKYGDIPIYGHKELYSTECPGTNFPLEDFKNMRINDIYKVGWNQNSTGWYYLTNIQGWYYKDVWQLIDGEWYSFDSQGYARKSVWLQDCGQWYYLDNNCIMAKYCWKWIDGECYRFDEHGAACIDCITLDGYKVDSSGAWIR